MTQTDAWEAFSRWQSSDHTDLDAARVLSRLVGWNVAERYAEPYIDPWFWDGEIEGVIERDYGIPEHENPVRDLGTWQLGMRVKVYWNLHEHRWSVVARDSGRVVAHAQTVYLVGPRFTVSEAGRRRVLTEQRKNVHAYVVGELAGIDVPPPSSMEGWSTVTYNPYRDTTFIDRDTRQPIGAAELAYLDTVTRDGKHTPRVRADGAMDVPVRANTTGSGEVRGQNETVYATKPPAGIGGVNVQAQSEAAAHLPFDLVVTPVLAFGNRVPTDPTGWEWAWHGPGVGSLPTQQGTAPTRGDAIREAIRVITDLPDYNRDSPRGNIIAGLLSDLALDERLAHVVKDSLAKTATDPDDVASYADLLDLVVAGINSSGSGVQTGAVKRVIAAMQRNADEIHDLLLSSMGRPPFHGRFDVTMLKGWTRGAFDAWETPPFGTDPAIVGESWRNLRGGRISQRNADLKYAGYDADDRAVPLPADQYGQVSSKVGTMLFLYRSDERDRGLMPATAIRLHDGWHEIRTAPARVLPQAHSDQQMVDMLKRGYPTSDNGTVPWVAFFSPTTTNFARAMAKGNDQHERSRALYDRLRRVSVFLPGYSHWAPTLYATSAHEQDLHQRIDAIPTPPAKTPHDRAVKAIKAAQRAELTQRARRRYVAARLGLGGMIPVRRNYVQVILAVLELVLPIIIDKLGSSLDEFNRMPRIERQRKLIAMLSSKLWWLSANPVTVAAARQVAASQKMQDALLDLLEKHGTGAVAVAGDAAQAAVQGKK